MTTATPVNQSANNSQVAAGQMFPEDYNNEFSVISFMIKQKLAELETNTPVQVVAVHPGSGTPPAAGTVDVQLLVSLLDGNGNAQQQGIVYGLPYYRLQGGLWAVICDPAANDFGFIVGCSRDISGVLKTPGISNPGSFRMFSFSDAIYVGGAFNKVPAATLWLKSDGTLVLTTKDGVVIKSDGSGNLTINDSHSNKIVTASTGITMTDGNSNTIKMEAGDITLNANGTQIVASHTTNRINLTATAGLWVNGVQVTVP